jgi:tetratricopeptide (TPR) repeat protein
MSAPGRNDACPCGSGKKYKKCCLPRDEAARPRLQASDPEEPFIAEIRPDVEEAVDRIMERLELGAGRALESEIKALLEKHPRNHLTHYAMGVYQATVMKDSVAAMSFFEKATQIFPPFPEAHINLGLTARQLGDIPKAVRAQRAAIRCAGGDSELLDRARAELEMIERVVLKNAPFANLDEYVAHAQLFEEAFERLSAREFEKAIELFGRVLSADPRHVQSHGNLALAYAGVGRRADALESLDRALAIDPEYEPATSNRRVIERMREGEPLTPEEIKETHYYLERINREKGIPPHEREP